MKQILALPRQPNHKTQEYHLTPFAGFYEQKARKTAQTLTAEIRKKHRKIRFPAQKSDKMRFFRPFSPHHRRFLCAKKFSSLRKEINFLPQSGAESSDFHTNLSERRKIADKNRVLRRYLGEKTCGFPKTKCLRKRPSRLPSRTAFADKPPSAPSGRKRSAPHGGKTPESRRARIAYLQPPLAPAPNTRFPETRR